MSRADRLVAALRAEPTLLGLSAALLYALGIGWGLPHATGPERMFPWGPDELAPLRSLGELYRVFVSPEGGFSPQYPLMHYFVQAVFAAPYALWLLATGGIDGISGTYPFGLVDPEGSLAVFTILARLPTVLMAGGTVAVAWWTGRRLRDREAGRFAALATMLAYPMFYYGRTANVDVPALFWLACGTAVFAAVLRDGLDVRRGTLLGLFAALSVATKDAGYAYFAVLGAALIVIQLRAWRGGEAASSALRPLLAGLGCATAVYAVASGLVFSVDRFLAHVDFIVHGTPLPEGVEHPYYYSGEASLGGYLRLAGTTLRHVSDALGLPLALAGAAGVAVSLRRSPRACLLLLPPVGIFLGSIVPVRFVLIRFVLPIAYVVGLFAGFALAALLARGRSGGPPGRAAAALVAGVCLAWAAVRAADLTVQMWSDTRYELEAWLDRTLEPGAEVGYYGSSIKLPRLPADVRIGAMPGQVLPPDPGQRVASDPDVVLVIPQQDNEPVHEWTLRPEDYRALLDGSAGYRRALELEGGGWFGRRVIPFVNPPVRAFVPREGG